MLLNGQSGGWNGDMRLIDTTRAGAADPENLKGKSDRASGFARRLPVRGITNTSNGKKARKMGATRIASGTVAVASQVHDSLRRTGALIPGDARKKPVRDIDLARQSYSSETASDMDELVRALDDIVSVAPKQMEDVTSAETFNIVGSLVQAVFDKSGWDHKYRREVSELFTLLHVLQKNGEVFFNQRCEYSSCIEESCKCRASGAH